MIAFSFCFRRWREQSLERLTKRFKDTAQTTGKPDPVELRYYSSLFPDLFGEPEHQATGSVLRSGIAGALMFGSVYTWKALWLGFLASSRLDLVVMWQSSPHDI